MKRIKKVAITSALVTSLAFSSYSAVHAASFDDVTGFASEQSITKLVSLGIMRNNTTIFNPSDSVKRSEFSAVINRVVSQGNPNVVKVTDLDVTNGKNNAALKMLNLGVFKLNKNGQFRPGKMVTYFELSKALALGLGFKASWTKDPVDYLYFLDRKGVLDIDTDLDAEITREDLAVAIDKYLKVKDFYNNVSGVVVEVRDTHITIKNELGEETYNFHSNASLFLDDQASEASSLGLGTVVTLTLNNNNEVAYAEGIGLDQFEGTLTYDAGKIKVDTKSLNVNLNAYVTPLPNNPEGDFSFTILSNYMKNGVQFFGTVLTSVANDEVTVITASVSKVDKKPFKVTGSNVEVDFSGNALPNQTFTVDDSVKVSVTEGETKKDVTLKELVALQTSGKVLSGTLEISAEGVVKTITATATTPPAKN
ncbi:S-layer homology domain-containing protein [Bacillus luteolus]|uniref:S-layer homology domain-containing protein n=1 Tax=Litchfieldia luteola TaxID=682179 RepID=A0ABR9QF85_9BACI|nr:S-layer homology domain-containing protein [Cytobacillus luteolus]MBE4907157.1 S-layer homology domain-containing protein [Cytobacillus luteolus]MBP1943373.1 hypothetical protein [Cytobacillus luteolus]